MSSVVAFDIAELRPGDMNRFEAAVTAERRARAARFFHIDDHKRCLTAGVLLRYALTHHFGKSIRHIAIRQNRFGKPFLKCPTGIFFNVSHSGRWVVCATSRIEIGIDIERVNAGNVDLARRLAPDECSYIMSAPAEERPRRFAQIWTLKEGYLKCLGKGINVPLDSFSVVSDEGRPQVLRGSLDSRPTLKQVVHDFDYYLAECCADDTEISVEEPGVAALLAVCPPA